ncbi:hypothetical protein COI41_29885 [Bacillus toyonensis]|uniref:hypothetical protein n=3 Tax=Bacillus toyonensis TaxID=155322 RepID=UPI000BEF8760|nr:hypothetical protein [Bacillus toyonensis]PEO57640.1 hypothetical protein CN567_27600 [Bacillus toyonensis]PFX75222.1 hypothetical protein COL38_29635 [Bacillus toyonensis]PHF47981.1 hypothetical protein COI41_29885 [Bacillus toyonensis]
MEETEIKNYMLKKVLPWLLIHYDVDDLYIENKDAALKIIMEKLDKEEILDQKNMMLVTHGFHQSKKKFLEMLDRFDEEDFSENKEMLLFKAVSILESAVNKRLHQELQIQHGMSHAKIDNILTRLKIKEKLDWFLQILCGETFLQQKGWDKINPIITLRNSFIHPKPTDADKYTLQVDSISKESLLEFMEACTECYNFLNDIRSSEVQKYNEKINRLAELVDQK